jgi:hypothetical protein
VTGQHHRHQQLSTGRGDARTGRYPGHEALGMNGPGCVACRTHEAGTSHQHPEALQTASEGGQRGQRGVCELAWYLGCPGGLVDKISAAVQIVDGNIGCRVVQWYYYTRSFAARGFLVQPLMENQRWRSKKEASCVSRPICGLEHSTPSKASTMYSPVLRTSGVLTIAFYSPVGQN